METILGWGWGGKGPGGVGGVGWRFVSLVSGPDYQEFTVCIWIGLGLSFPFFCAWGSCEWD
jgi:hypothetical protein